MNFYLYICKDNFSIRTKWKAVVQCLVPLDFSYVWEEFTSVIASLLIACAINYLWQINLKHRRWEEVLTLWCIDASVIRSGKHSAGISSFDLRFGICCVKYLKWGLTTRLPSVLYLCHSCVCSSAPQQGKELLWAWKKNISKRKRAR